MSETLFDKIKDPRDEPNSDRDRDLWGRSISLTPNNLNQSNHTPSSINNNQEDKQTGYLFGTQEGHLFYH